MIQWKQHVPLEDLDDLTARLLAADRPQDMDRPYSARDDYVLASQLATEGTTNGKG